MNTPIGERIWKREVADDSKSALLIAVTLRREDDLKKQFAPFVGAAKQWWRASDSAKTRDFLITVIDEVSRHEEIRQLLGEMILNDRDLRVIFSGFRAATLLFGTEEGAQPGDYSLKTLPPPADSYLPAWTSRKWLGRKEPLLAAVRAQWQSVRPRKKLVSFSPHEPDIADDKGAPARAKHSLLLGGHVVWGYIARAFFPAYVPGRNTHYGSVVYAVEEHEPDSVFELAWAVNQLRKDKSPPPRGTEKVANAIRDDRSSFPRIRLPLEIGSHGDSYFANLCIHRTRLPGGYLHDRLLPLLIAPKETEWCCILPLRGWTPELCELWQSGPPAYQPEAFAAMFQQYKIKP